MADCVRNFDWGSTSLGRSSRWPDTLTTCASMVLTATIPMQLFLGPEFICLYNDAMVPALSDKHPASLGQPAAEVWKEAWSVIGPQLEHVRSRGEALSFKDVFLPLLRNGKLIDQYWEYSYSPIFDPKGVVVGVLDIAQDVTEPVMAREAMRRSEERFRLLVERASVGINIENFAGELTYVNQKLLDLIGYTEDEVRQGKVRWDELTPARYSEADQHALKELRATGIATPYQKTYRTRDGRHVPVQLGAVLIPALSPNAPEDDIAVFFTDLTTQKKAEAALLQAEKLSAVGRLASTISHEINNPLEAITNLLYIIRHDPELPQMARDYLDLADRELARVSQVATETLRFHRQSTAATIVQPDVLADQVLKLYSGRLGNYSIEVLRDYAADVSFRCFEGDIRQVLSNLIGNAIDAMRTGGRLTLRTRETTRWSTGQRGILITVADSGMGFSEAVKQQLFEAFFTTKGNNGSGLGLWISCRIVHKHRGYIRAYNAVGGQGAVFQLWLPLALAPTARESWHNAGEEAVLP